MRLKKHARIALKVARGVAQAVGCDVVSVGMTGQSHYRFAVVRDGQELGRFTLSETPKCTDDSRNLARQLTRRVIRGGG